MVWYGRWYRDPTQVVPKNEITRFPHAVLEVKLQLKVNHPHFTCWVGLGDDDKRNMLFGREKHWILTSCIFGANIHVFVVLCRMRPASLSGYQS